LAGWTGGLAGWVGVLAGWVGAAAGWPEVVMQWKRNTSRMEREETTCLVIFVVLLSLGSCVCLGNLELLVSVFDMCGKEERAFMQGERV